MYKRPFLVTTDHECIPLEGPFRIEQVCGVWHVLGRHQVHPCEGERAAQMCLDRLTTGADTHALGHSLAQSLVEQALEGLPVEYDVVAQTSVAQTP
jgi:hypothetical protein